MLLEDSIIVDLTYTHSILKTLQEILSGIQRDTNTAVFQAVAVQNKPPSHLLCKVTIVPTRRTTFIFVTLLKYFSNTLFNCFYDGLESHNELILRKKAIKQAHVNPDKGIMPTEES